MILSQSHSVSARPVTPSRNVSAWCVPFKTPSLQSSERRTCKYSVRCAIFAGNATSKVPAMQATHLRTPRVLLRYVEARRPPPSNWALPGFRRSARAVIQRAVWSASASLRESRLSALRLVCPRDLCPSSGRWLNQKNLFGLTTRCRKMKQIAIVLETLILILHINVGDAMLFNLLKRSGASRPGTRAFYPG